MAYVLCLTTIYLLAVAIIFYASGKIIGKEIITRNKIMQRVKGQYEEDDEDITFAEAIEELPEEERDDYRKNFIIECALLVFFVIMLAVVIYLISDIRMWNAQALGLIIVFSIVIAILAFMYAYKNVSSENYYYDSNDYSEIGMWSELYRMINDKDCRNIDVFKIDEANTIACILDKNGKTKNVCYYDLTKLPNDGEKLHVNEQLMNYLRKVRSMAREDIVIDDKVPANE